MSLRGQRWWLVGASEGLGRALATAMAADGAEVIVSARTAERLDALAGDLPGARAVTVDVADTGSVREAAQQVGQVDGVVFLAGAYWPLGVRDWDGDKIQTMLDVNLSGAVRVLDSVLPGMIERGRGQIVLTGSLAGYRGLPGALGYGASKAALMHLAECLQADLHGSGVVVQQVNPGFVRTRLTDKNEFAMPFLMEPDAAAAQYLAAIRSGKPHAAFPRLFSLLFRVGRFVPQGLWLRFFARGGG
jgi:short-subunit dehydrogenase